DPANALLGYVMSDAKGGTNGNGVPSGGSISYGYTDLNPARAMPDFPHNLFLVQTLKTSVTDRNGNQSSYLYSGEKMLVEYREFPRGLRNGEPTADVGYLTQQEWNGRELRRSDHLLTTYTKPEGNTLEYTYNDGATDRFQQGNLIRIVA